jgi:hypothetical protein
LITKRSSFLECFNVVDEAQDWSSVEASKLEITTWFKSIGVKSFYSASKSPSFGSGCRAALEMSGLGKLRPNMVLLGYKKDWQQGIILVYRYCIKVSFGKKRYP